MKPFDLARALAGDPIITRSNIKVPEIFHFQTANEHCEIVAVINGQCINLYKNGRFRMGIDSDHDLFMAPNNKKLWIAVEKTPQSCGSHCTSRAVPKEHAELLKDNGPEFQIVEIEIEE